LGTRDVKQYPVNDIGRAHRLLPPVTRAILGRLRACIF